MVAPAKTPHAVVARLDTALKQTLAHDDIHTRLLNAGSTPVRSSPELFGAQIAEDFARWKRVIFDAKLKLDT